MPLNSGVRLKHNRSFIIVPRSVDSLIVIIEQGVVGIIGFDALSRIIDSAAKQ